MKIPNMILFSSFVFLLSCNSSKPVIKPQKFEFLNEIQSTIVFNPRTGTYDTVYVRNNIDTVIWKNPPLKSTAAPIGAKTTPMTKIPAKSPDTAKGNATKIKTKTETSPPAYRGVVAVPTNSKIKSTYQLTYLLPFFSDKFSNQDKNFYEKSEWALNFYAGAKLALDSLKSQNININVNVLDTKANESQLENLLGETAVQNADVIIGTETNANVSMAAEFAKKNGKILISPYNPAGEIVTSNKQFVQINPSLRTNCEAIMRDIRKNYSAEQIVLICRNKINEREAMQYLQMENQRLNESKSSLLKEYILEEKGGIASFDPKLAINNESMVFVVPIWGQNSETFIYSLLTKINNAKGKKKIVVYGLPQWSNFQVNVFDVFEPLQVHITQPVYVDKTSVNARAFSSLFFKTYAAAPNEEAYMGYDITLYVGNMLYNYGTKFNEVLDQVPYEGMYSKLHFEKEKSFNGAYTQEDDDFDRIANKYVNILKFQNGCFLPVE
ncbi:MAG: hypothetical protein ACOYOA_09925 [Saprospiraceae bacterium]